MRRPLVCVAALALSTVGVVAQAPLPAPTAQAASAPEYGPAKGTLVIIGGNMSDNFGVSQKFIQLAGGPAKKFVIIPTTTATRTKTASRSSTKKRKFSRPGKSAA